MVEKELTRFLLTVGAGGFLPGIPLGCFGMCALPLRPRSTRFLKLEAYGFPVNLEPRPLRKFYPPGKGQGYVRHACAAAQEINERRGGAVPLQSEEKQREAARRRRPQGTNRLRNDIRQRSCHRHRHVPRLKGRLSDP